MYVMVGSPLSIASSPINFGSPNYSFGLQRNPNAQSPIFGGPLTDSFYSSGGYSAGLGYNPGLGSGAGFPIALMLMPLILGVIPLLQSLFSGNDENNEGKSSQARSDNRKSNNVNNSNGCNCAKSMNLDISDEASYSGDHR